MSSGAVLFTSAPSVSLEELNSQQHDDSGGEDQVQQAVGRWTDEEHDMFIQGLKMFGKEWKKIATLVKTRTVVQVRTHAQKYFQKMAKQREATSQRQAKRPTKRRTPGSTPGGHGRRAGSRKQPRLAAPHASPSSVTRSAAMSASGGSETSDGYNSSSASASPTSAAVRGEALAAAGPPPVRVYRKGGAAAAVTSAAAAAAAAVAAAANGGYKFSPPHSAPPSMALSAHGARGAHSSVRGGGAGAAPAAGNWRVRGSGGPFKRREELLSLATMMPRLRGVGSGSGSAGGAAGAGGSGRDAGWGPLRFGASDKLVPGAGDQEETAMQLARERTDSVHTIPEALPPSDPPSGLLDHPMYEAAVASLHPGPEVGEAEDEEEEAEAAVAEASALNLSSLHGGKLHRGLSPLHGELGAVDSLDFDCLPEYSAVAMAPPSSLCLPSS
mmetsp:Transcript_6185/g.19708  ORF Transcript_6185/g.19708 Transcript_6185/m.19708 type:complete len:441 (+) Transcript_6185:128-1450(+)|eukprot:CAMPEP_0196772028 /NCGR_PEP_ID=MMETSP1104-20130614/2007_1 /TAXON_ID=33652 /ORGANISM="Cafeteria sp., Strain Caron Lab Isolate" /LENGTH=440 /DNA_ID=CAMNT_0042142159 /DNA_START=128 /DNA_END=1450 /DNA_ORIENTATION=-